MYMRKTAEKTKKGARFEALASPRGVKASIAVRLKIDNTVINNWRYRGVPAEYAYIVAEILKCQPEEISDVLPADTKISRARELLPTIDDALQVLYSERDNLSASDLASLKMILDFIERTARARLDSADNTVSKL